jgi:hypothetical protein
MLLLLTPGEPGGVAQGGRCAADLLEAASARGGVVTAPR